MSADSEFRSASGRPTSPGMTLNSDLVAGVKKRMLRLRVEEQRRDIGAVEDVLQIVGRGALPLERFLQLAVERGQLLVERLQLLLRGQQLLVGRLVFLVDRQRLFVDRLLLFVRDLEVVDGALQLGPASPRAPARARRCAARRASAPAGAGLLALQRLSVDEADQQQLLRRRLGTGWTSMSNGTAAPSRSIWPPGTTTARVALRWPAGSPTGAWSAARLRHGEQILRRMARRHAQIAVGRPERIEALVLAVDQDGRRRVVSPAPAGGTARQAPPGARAPGPAGPRWRPREFGAALRQRRTSPGRERPIVR